MDLAERMERLQERNSEPLPENQSYSDEDAKAVFLTALEEGKTIPEAAKLAGRTATWFRRRRNRDSWQLYDPDFTNRFDEIVGEEGPWREAVCLRMLTAMVQAAESGSVRAQEKILATYSREFSWLKPALSQGSLNIEQVKVYLTSVPDSLLDQMIQAAQEKQKALPPVIDA